MEKIVLDVRELIINSCNCYSFFTELILHPQIGEQCDNNNTLRSGCPKGSRCSLHSGKCRCRSDLVPTRDGSACRPPLYGEPCHRRLTPCRDDLGFECRSETYKNNDEGVCGCKDSHRAPSSWARFILTRWNYSTVNEAFQKCVARKYSDKYICMHK